MRPYTPLELEGRDIYVREGCYLCHSQMIRPLRDEVERYGHYSLAAESMYDHPFQWGSKRTGPDLARVGGKYSDEWHARPPDRSALGGAGIGHAALRLPGRRRRSTTATSPNELKAQPEVGVPYTDDRSPTPRPTWRPRPIPTATAPTRCRSATPKAQVRDFDGKPEHDHREDALIAYLQMLGTLVDFSTYHADAPANQR